MLFFVLTSFLILQWYVLRKGNGVHGEVGERSSGVGKFALHFAPSASEEPKEKLH